MKPLSIGIIRERKTPPDNRTPLTPRQCAELKLNYPDLEIKVEWSPIRCFTDEDYQFFDIKVVEEVKDCDLLLGIKEVPVDNLVADKTYMFFSHTIKKQPHNRKLLQAILKKNITLIDYETLTDEKEQRLVGFGKWAGIVGAHYALLMLGNRTQSYKIKPASQCLNLQEVFDQYYNLKFPAVKMVITGGGRVAHGAIEVMHAAGIRQVTKKDYLEKEFEAPVFVQLHSENLYILPGEKTFDKHHFYHHPQEYESAFAPFAAKTDILINCMFWDPRAPRLFNVEDIDKENFRIRIIADISCDVDGSCPVTYRESTIQDPIYGIHLSDKQIGKPYSEDSLDLMAVSNLPNELPRDASRDFGKILQEIVIPRLITNPNDSLFERATITKNGKLTPRFSYLQDYVDGKE